MGEAKGLQQATTIKRGHDIKEAIKECKPQTPITVRH